MSEDFKTDILHWLEYDNKIISLSNDIKKLNITKEKLNPEEAQLSYLV